MPVGLVDASGLARLSESDGYTDNQGLRLSLGKSYGQKKQFLVLLLALSSGT